MDETISLLPFIESRGEGFRLDIPVISPGRNSSKGYSYPFQIVDNGQNFSIIVKAGLKGNHSDPFKSLFLFVQKDHYPISPDALTPLTNTGIDRIWCETILSYVSVSSAFDKKVFTLPGQINRDGTPIPFKPLFFCKKVKKFFHPPCPECGAELSLCVNDDLLKKSVLSVYSTSLKRYLFCPTCHASRGNFEFYQFSRSADDSVFTKDRFDLVKDFNRLKTVGSNDFPCLACSNHAECYITGEKATSYINFFSFYPFHMLLFDAQPIQATDFMPFLSGASVEDISTFSATPAGTDWKNMMASHGGESFFFKNENRFFIEILYLKLSFFEAFTRALSQRIETQTYPLMNLSARSIWIRPATQGSSLPFFWDFNLTLIDLTVNGPRNCIESSLTRNTSLNFIASLWFFAFLVNSRQTLETVYEAIGILHGKNPDEHTFGDYNTLIKECPHVAMENIFWDPNNAPTPQQKWTTFWSRILKMGMGFLNEKTEQDLKGSLNKFLNQIQMLKKDVKAELFSKNPETNLPGDTSVATQSEQVDPPPTETTDPSAIENQAITRILKQLKKQWEAQETPTPDLDDDVLETVVLSSDDSEPNMDFDDTLDETVILRVPEKGSAAVLETTHDQIENTGFDDMEKTVILSPDTAPRQSSHSFGDDDDLDKTIIITPKK